MLLDFYPRSPCGERQNADAELKKRIDISIHALLAESDAASRGLRFPPLDFYPRSPCGERRRGRAGILRICDFYPRSPCGERQWMRVDFLTVEEISIHALLAESDAPDQRAAHGTSDFYPRSPCGERHS